MQKKFDPLAINICNCGVEPVIQFLLFILCLFHHFAAESVVPIEKNGQKEE